MRIYISGAMTGVFNYREHFNRAEEYIRGLGHIAVNPAFLPEGLEDYFEINKAMIDQCDGIYVLSNSDNSVGTKKELEYAQSKGWTIENGKIQYEAKPVEKSSRPVADWVYPLTVGGYADASHPNIWERRWL